VVRRTIRASAAVHALLGSVATAFLVVVALSIGSRQGRLLLFATVALLALLVLMVLPVQVLPALALLASVLVPDRMADYGTSPLVTPGTVVLLVWLGRRLLVRANADPVAPREGAPGTDRLRKALVTSAVLLGAIMLPLMLVAPSKLLSVAWTFTYLVAIVGPLLVGDLDREARALSDWLPGIAAVTAAYAVLQAALQRNVLYTPIYDALGKPDNQHWAVYRSDSSFGHPLVAGLFFSVALAFCVGRWLETRRLRFLAIAVLSGLGVVSTVSRGSYVAAAGSVIVLTFVVIATQSRGRLRLVVIVMGLAVATRLALSSSTFVERGLSGEASSSYSSRSNLPTITLDTARAYHFLGGGPASSAAVAEPFNFQGLPIENSFMQLLIDVGAVGLLLFITVLALAVIIGIRNRNSGAWAGVVAYSIAVSGFAALDSRRTLLVVLGMLIVLCLRSRAAFSPPVVSGQRGRTGRLDSRQPAAHRAATTARQG